MLPARAAMNLTSPTARAPVLRADLQDGEEGWFADLGIATVFVIVGCRSERWNSNDLTGGAT